jgi:hypothetical protein
MVGGPYTNHNAEWAALAWSFGLLAVLVPLAIRSYRRA